jgi:hypothetical protein
MKTKILFLLLIVCRILNAQDFTNGDLDGTINGYSSLPTGWQRVPRTDVNCLAALPGNDTPDLTSLTEPSIFVGVIGNPFSSNTFVSGSFASNPPNFFQEGIMQQANGFIVGHEYSIRFRQAVVKQNNGLDESGSWAVYIDTVLASITMPTNSKELYNSTSFVWELRTLSFIATATSHLIKFLPMDDDSNYTASLTDTIGALRMGIDSIELEAIIDGLASINLSQGEAFKLVPNPSNGSFTLQSISNSLLNVSIQNLSGQMVYVKTIQTQNSKVSIDDAALTKGMYIVKISNDHGTQCLKLVVE